MARRIGTIVDLVELQLGGQRRFVLSLEENKKLIFLICDDEELQQRLAGDVISFLLEDELSPGTVKTIQPVLLRNSRLGLGGNPPILKHLIFLICDDEELQQRLAGDVISFILEDELSPGTVKTIQPVLQRNSRLGLGGNPPILSFFDYSKDYGTEEWAEELDLQFANLTDESRRFLESIPGEPEFRSSFDLCRLTLVTSLNVHRSDQVAKQISIRKKSLEDLQNLTEKFNSSEESEHLGINNEINISLSDRFGCLDSDSCYYFQLEHIVKYVESNLIHEQETLRRRTRSNTSSVDTYDSEEEKLVDGEVLENVEYVSVDEASDRVLKACRFMQEAMFYRVGVMFLLKINTLLSDRFGCLYFDSCYYFQLEHIVKNVENYLIHEQETLRRRTRSNTSSVDDQYPNDLTYDSEEEKLVDGEVEYVSAPNMSVEEASDKVLKACRFMQEAMFYRVGVMFLLKDNPSDFSETALAAKQAEHDEVLKRLQALIEEDERLERELCAKHRELCDIKHNLWYKGEEDQSVANRFAEALFAVRPEFRSRLQQFDQ
uniref:Kinesin motor domain-containing protein n=1 Tax=Steinernema glaseri TaxID=37863 RepID=A0A1I7Y0G3_9BILA